MKLNVNCIRDILLTVEEECDFETPWEYQEDSPPPKFLADYTHKEIVYHINQAQKSDLICGVEYFECGSDIYISDLTPKGHEFLSNIRNDTVWKRCFPKLLVHHCQLFSKLQKKLLRSIFLVNRKLNQYLY